MSTQTVVVPTNNVEGNITNCKIETAEIRVDKASPSSFVQYTTYQSYDVCTKEVKSEYVIPEVTGFAVVIGLCLGIVFISILMAWSSSDSYYN